MLQVVFKNCFLAFRSFEESPKGISHTDMMLTMITLTRRFNQPRTSTDLIKMDPYLPIYLHIGKRNPYPYHIKWAICQDYFPKFNEKTFETNLGPVFGGHKRVDRRVQNLITVSALVLYQKKSLGPNVQSKFNEKRGLLLDGYPL